MGGGTAAGGGAMRAAVKVASYGVGGKLRGNSSVPWPDQSVAGGVSRKAPRPSSVGLVTSSPVSEEAGAGGVSPVLSANGKNERVGLDRPVQMPAWEFDDWELAGAEEEEEGMGLVDSVRPMARVVFGGAPSRKEAQEATSDLRGIIEQEYFPSNATGSRQYANALREPILAVASLPGCSETKDLVTSEDAVAPPAISTSALLAFKMLKENRDVQTIVASLASDKHVWNAVTNNEMVVEFIKNNKISTFISIPDDAHNGNNNQKSSSRFDDDDAKDSEGSENVFAKLMNNIKLVLEKMIGNLSELVQSIFGGTGADLSVNANRSNDDKAAFKGSFMALAVLAVVVVLMKRA